MLYSTQSYQKGIKVLDNPVYRFLLTISIPLLISIILSVIVTILAQHIDWMSSEYSFLHSLLIIGLGTFIGYYIIDFPLSIIIIHRKSLKNTENYFTQHRIISISTYNREEYLIISIPFNKIHLYFVKSPEKKPFYHIYFNTEPMSDEEMSKCFQMAKKVSRVKNGIVVGLDVIFKLPEKEFVLIWKNIVKTKTILELLSQFLPNKQSDLTIPKSGLMSIEAHLGL